MNRNNCRIYQIYEIIIILNIYYVRKKNIILSLSFCSISSISHWYLSTSHLRNLRKTYLFITQIINVIHFLSQNKYLRPQAVNCRASKLSSTGWRKRKHLSALWFHNSVTDFHVHVGISQNKYIFFNIFFLKTWQVTMY